MRPGTALAVLAVFLVALAPVAVDDVAIGEGLELRTWATTCAAPAGDPLCESPSFTLRSRLGGPFVGHAESASFALWGCGAYTPVEGAFYAEATDSECVVLRWTVETLAGIDGFHVYRSLIEDGPFERITGELLPAESPGVYEDRSVWPGTAFWYEVRAVSPDGSEETIGGAPATATTGGRFVTQLYAASPNPFRGETVIRLDLAASRQDVRLTIFDVSGRIVRTVVSEPLRAGRHELRWDGRSDTGRTVAAGVYFCRLEAGEFSENRPIVLLK